MKDWYQLDFRITNTDFILRKEGSQKIRKIFSIMGELVAKNLIDKWFFLQEGSKLRIRWYSTNKEATKREIEIFSNNNSTEIVIEPNPLYKDDYKPYYIPKIPFSDYGEEDMEAFPNKEVVEFFANIMSEKDITATSDIGDTGNVKFMRIILHCLKNEIILLKETIANL